MMRVTIDPGECIGCGLCSEDCPDVFELREDGLSWVLPADGRVHEAQRDCVETAADVCPTEAIRLE
jgi:ferredoxin